MCFDVICEFSTWIKAVEAKVKEQKDTMDGVSHQLITVQKKADEQEELMILRKRVDEQPEEKTIERQAKAIQTLEMQMTRALDVIGEMNDRLKRTVEGPATSGDPHVTLQPPTPNTSQEAANYAPTNLLDVPSSTPNPPPTHP
jgi:uncharacterized coiled-coil protein SlyX